MNWIVTWVVVHFVCLGIVADSPDEFGRVHYDANLVCNWQECSRTEMQKSFETYEGAAAFVAAGRENNNDISNKLERFEIHEKIYFNPNKCGGRQ